MSFGKTERGEQKQATKDCAIVIDSSLKIVFATILTWCLLSDQHKRNIIQLFYYRYIFTKNLYYIAFQILNFK